jgi:hypothetical protein
MQPLAIWPTNQMPRRGTCNDESARPGCVGVTKRNAFCHRHMRNTMQRTLVVTLAVLAFALRPFAQDDLPIFKANAASAFVWGEDNPSGAVSSSMRDPLTGNAIHNLSHAGIEVSSRAGFESIGMGTAGEFLIFTTTIINNTGSVLSVRQSGASVDGHMALPLSLVPSRKGLSKGESKLAWELQRMHCFSSGSFPNQNFFSSLSSNSSKIFTVTPKTALTISFVTKDPRNYSVLCSLEGCYPKGTIRFSVTVNATDFVFVWPGRGVAYCGR